jgi:hypothetical protein
VNGVKIRRNTMADDATVITPPLSPQEVRTGKVSFDIGKYNFCIKRTIFNFMQEKPCQFL